jgi:hypothetical protein
VNTGLVPDGVFNTDGTTNNVVLNASNTTMVGFAPFSAIDYVIVVLSDGSQHMTEYGFDYRSISEWIAVP